MNDDKEVRPSTESYKGVRDFYPKDMAIQQYIFDTWARVAESFGFERYDASILEPSELYRAKSSEEIVNDQTYTFTDRGDREVTLRPEMTPTVARMVAGKRRELSLPLRWYSIPNLFRYERAQRGRLREHWQLNADIFGVHHENADVEIILLASEVLQAFGAKESDFVIHINNRQLMVNYFSERYGISDANTIAHITRLFDQKNKIADSVFNDSLLPILSGSQEKLEQLRKDIELDVQDFVHLLNTEFNHSTLLQVKNALSALGVSNVKFDATLARGFTYYTGTIFEIFDTNPDNRRSLLGGGRYDNLTGLFGGDPIPAVGFGMGDVTMRDFLETHDLLTQMPSSYTSAPTIMLVTENTTFIPTAEKLAQALRTHGVRVGVNLGDKSIGEQRKKAAEAGTLYTINVDALSTSETFTAKNLCGGDDIYGSIHDIAKTLLT